MFSLKPNNREIFVSSTSSKIICPSDFADSSWSVKSKLVDRSSSGRERPWRVYKQFSEFLSEAFTHLEYKGLATRVNRCADRLWFWECMESKEHPKKLKSGYFCKHRLCVNCQWRKSMRQYHTSKEIALEALRRHPTIKFVFLTLTMPNVVLRNLSGLSRSF